MRWFFVLPLLLSACAPRPAEFPAGTEANFMLACQAQSTAASCTCIWDKIEAENSPAEYVALERMSAEQRRDHPLTRRIEGYALACAASSAPAP